MAWATSGSRVAVCPIVIWRAVQSPAYELGRAGNLTPASIAGSTKSWACPWALIHNKAPDRIRSDSSRRTVGNSVSADRDIGGRSVLIASSPCSGNWSYGRGWCGVEGSGLELDLAIGIILSVGGCRTYCDRLDASGHGRTAGQSDHSSENEKNDEKWKP